MVDAHLSLYSEDGLKVTENEFCGGRCPRISSFAQAFSKSLYGILES